MTSLACTRSGIGAPLVLLHGLGSSRQAWNPVIPALAARFDVIAVDLPGFGDSNPVPAQAKPTPAALAAAVAGLLDELGVSAPHLAGNSLGGWVALELAATRPAASLTLLSPAGLWRQDAPGYPRASLRATRWLTRHASRPLSRLVTYRLGRATVLGQTHGRPMRLTAEYAQAAIHAMGACPGFDATFTATAPRRYLATTPITAPVSVAFGSRDRLLRRHQSRYPFQLPPGTRVEALPGCGHVPMADDPGAVTALITRSARRAAASNDAASGNAATDDARTALRPLSHRRPRAAGPVFARSGQPPATPLARLAAARAARERTPAAGVEGLASAAYEPVRASRKRSTPYRLNRAGAAGRNRNDGRQPPNRAVTMISFWISAVSPTIDWTRLSPQSSRCDRL
jgi:pimeloyl-ACP methyl ester carboxylesterase